MDAQAQLAALLELAYQVGLSIRKAPPAGEFTQRAGSLVRLKGAEILFLDPDASPADQVAVLAKALAGRQQLQETFLPPEIRELLGDG